MSPVNSEDEIIIPVTLEQLQGTARYAINLAKNKNSPCRMGFDDTTMESDSSSMEDNYPLPGRDVAADNLTWQNESGLLEEKLRLRSLSPEERAKITPPSVRDYVPWTEMASITEDPPVLTLEQRQFCNDSTISLCHAMIGLPQAAQQRILAVVSHKDFDSKHIPPTVHLLNKVADYCLVKLRKHEVTLPAKPRKRGQARPDQVVSFYKVEELIAYIVRHKGMAGWTFETRMESPVIASVWDSTGAQRYAQKWTVEIESGGRMLLLVLYWDDYKQSKKRTHKVNAFYMRLLNHESEHLIYPICFASSTVDVNVLLQEIVTPSLRCLGKGISVDGRRFVGGVHVTSVDHMAKVQLVKLKNPGATYSEVYSHRRLEELSRVTDQAYKKRDPELHKLAFDRLQYLLSFQESTLAVRQEITRIRELFGLQDKGFPALSQVEGLDEALHMRQGIDYMHTETRGNLSQHGLALISHNQDLPSVVNIAVRSLPRYPHRPYFGANDVITTKRQPWSEEEGLHICLATSEQIDHFLCLLPILLYGKIPSFMLEAYEAHLQYTFMLTSKKGIARSDLPRLKALIFAAKRGMAALIPTEKLRRVKFASADYWAEQVEFLGPPMAWDSTIYENRHDGTKTIGAELTNRRDIEPQVLDELGRRMAFEIPFRQHLFTRVKLLITASRENVDSDGWRPCGDASHLETTWRFWPNARFNGFIISAGQFLSISISGVPAFHRFDGIYEYSIQGELQHELLTHRLAGVDVDRSTYLEFYNLGHQIRLPSKDVNVCVLLDVHEIEGRLVRNPYVRYPYYYGK